MKLSGSAVWTVITSAKLVVMAGWIIAPVVHLMREGLGIDPVSAGLIITTHALFTALFYPVFGICVRRIGAKKPLVFGLLLYGVAGGSGLVITSYWFLLVSRAFLGIGYAAALTSITAILDLYEKEEVHKMMGVSKETKAFGSINWPIFGGFLGIFSWHLPFAVYLAAIPLGFLALTSVPEIEREQPKDHAEKSPSGNTLEKSVLFVACGLTFLTNILLFAILVFLPQLLEETWVSFPFFVAVFFIVVMISSSVASSQYQKISSALSRGMIIVTGLGLCALAFTAMSQTYSGLVIFASVVLFGIGEGLITSAVTAWIDDIIPPSLLGRTESYQRTLGYLGQFLAPVVFFPAIVLSGLPGVFLAAAGVCTVLFLVALVSSKK